MQIRLRLRPLRRNLESRIHAVQPRRLWARSTPLPKPSIDTGAGLERLAAVLQGKISNFDTDLFVPLIERAAELTGTRPGASPRSDASLRIIADHARASTFLISDGVVPSNEGRGYVLRKILRRGIRHGRLLGTTEPFMAEMCRAVHAAMRGAYPELDDTIERVSKIMLGEETRFAHTLAVGLKRLDEDLEQATEVVGAGYQAAYRRGAGIAGHPVVPYDGAKAFRLYDTFGLPLDFISDAVRDAGLQLDEPGFNKAMEEQRTRARASWKGGHKDVANPVYANLAQVHRTEPDFYFATTAKDCRIEAIVTKDGAVNELPPGAEGEIILDRTVFYSESGGQVSDIGTLWNNEHTMQVADVRGAYYPVSGLIAHRVVAKEKLAVGDRVAGDADAARREHIKRNHTGDAPDARRAAQYSGHARQAGRLARRARDGCASIFRISPQSIRRSCATSSSR